MNEKPSPEVLPFGLLELDLKGKVIGFSPVAERYSEVRAQDVIGRDFFKEILTAADCEDLNKQFDTFMERGDSNERLFFSFSSFLFLLRAMRRLCSGRARLLARKGTDTTSHRPTHAGN